MSPVHFLFNSDTNSLIANCYEQHFLIQFVLSPPNEIIAGYQIKNIYIFIRWMSHISQ